MKWASLPNTLPHSMVVLSRTVSLWLQVQVRKTEQQLHQKEDMGEVLHVVDFDQLQVRAHCLLPNTIKHMLNPPCQVISTLLTMSDTKQA